MSDSVWPHRQQPTRLPRPWDSPGKNTGVGCHFLLQCMKVKSESEVAPSCPTLRDPMDYSSPGPPSVGFSRQEYWSGVPLTFPNWNSTDCNYSSKVIVVEILTFWFEIIMNQEVKNWGTTFKNSHVMFLKDLLNSFKIKAAIVSITDAHTKNRCKLQRIPNIFILSIFRFTSTQKRKV